MSSTQLFHLRKIHCDPHAGNFAFRKNGDVVVYDFGSTRTYTEDDIHLIKNLVKHALKYDVTALEYDLKMLNIRRDDDMLIPAEFYQQWLDILLTAIANDAEYNFGDSDIHLRAMKNAKSSLKYWDSFKPSPKTMMIDRTVNGIYWNIVNLGAKANFYNNIRHFIFDNNA